MDAKAKSEEVMMMAANLRDKGMLRGGMVGEHLGLRMNRDLKTKNGHTFKRGAQLNVKVKSFKKDSAVVLLDYDGVTEISVDRKLLYTVNMWPLNNLRGHT